MSPGAVAEVLVEIRNIIADIHDRRVGRRGTVDLVEQAALRDTVRRLNEAISSLPSEQPVAPPEAGK